MERVNCIVIEDNILEFLDEIQNQLSKGIVCCKCQNPCKESPTSKCAMAMKNLLTDIGIFIKTYSELNPKEEKKDSTVEQVIEKTVERQVLND